MTRHDLALRMIAYLDGKGRVPAKELYTYLGLHDDRALRTLARYTRKHICWINSCSTPGRNGYYLGERDSRQLEKHAASEFQPITIDKQRSRRNVVEQGELGF